MAISNKKIEAQLKKYQKTSHKIIDDSYKTRQLIQKLTKKITNTKIMREYGESIKSMCSLVSDYSLKEYTNVSKSSIIIIVSALVYVLSPIDLIPDVIPIIGYLDDIAVLAYAIKTVRVELVKYNVWLKEQKRTEF